jgi:zinc transport system permease protein
MILYSILLNIFFTTVGLWLSYSFDLTSGASIILVAAAGFFIYIVFEQLRPKRGNVWFFRKPPL